MYMALSEREIRIRTNRSATVMTRQSTKIAIGYLSSWAIDSYNEVLICDDFAEDSFIAHYDNTKTGGKYTIGAIYHKETDTYSFHS